VSSLSVPSSETSPSLAAIVEEVGADLPHCREKTSPDGMLTVAFTDIEASTEAMERLGEARWMAVMRTHNRIVRSCVSEYGGDVVKSRGDGFMVAFASATAALESAIALQRSLARHNDAEPDEVLRVRVGVHTGNIFQLEDDFLGKAVVLAARITGHARGGEILVSSDCREYTRRARDWRYGPAMELELKGLSSVARVYRLDWATERNAR
jgi:class 3 adenylate cyclase